MALSGPDQRTLQTTSHMQLRVYGTHMHEREQIRSRRAGPTFAAAVSLLRAVLACHVSAGGNAAETNLIETLRVFLCQRESLLPPLCLQPKIFRGVQIRIETIN